MREGKLIYIYETDLYKTMCGYINASTMYSKAVGAKLYWTIPNQRRDNVCLGFLLAVTRSWVSW